MSLSASLGHEYMDQFYRGAYFRLGDALCLYKGHVSAQTIRVSSIAPDMERWVSKDIPTESIKDMAAFSWPKLGYREYTMHSPYQHVKTVFLVSSARSAMRGLQDRHIRMENIPQQMMLGMGATPKEYLSPGQYVKALFFPKFTRFSDGMPELSEGKRLAFALNEDFAVAISVAQGQGVGFDVMYKGSIVGQVADNGEVVLPLRLRKKASVHNLFEGKVRV